MADIKSALNNLAKAILFAACYRECETIDSYTMNPTTSEKSISSEISVSGMKVSYVTVMIREMGTASYVAVGRPGYTEERLTQEGDIIEIQAPNRTFINTQKIMVVSDAADSIIEVGGVLIPKGLVQ